MKSDAASPSILIVDDNPFNRLFFSEVAKSEGFSVKEATNGKEALTAIQHNDFNLVILDLLMPGMDGFETAKAVRAMGKSVPLIAVSSLAFKQDRQKSFHAGCNAFYTKPIEIETVTSILKQYESKPDSVADSQVTRDSNDSARLENFFKGHPLILVEESNELREMFSKHLQNAGFKVTEFNNGTEASLFLNEIHRTPIKQEGTDTNGPCASTSNPDRDHGRIDRIHDDHDRAHERSDKARPTQQSHIVISNIFTSGIDGLGLLTNVKRKFPETLVFLYTPTYDTAMFQYAVQQKVDGMIPQNQFLTAALDIVTSALQQPREKRIFDNSEADTVAMVRKAQAQLMHSGCKTLCPFLNIAYQPLHEAGGDMVRCRRFGKNGECGIVLTDVAGHDVTSSYTNATFSGIMLSLWDDCTDPLELLKRINRELIKMGNDQSHVCATTLLLNRWTGHVEMATAGNPGALLLHINENGSFDFKTLVGGGMVLGMLEQTDLFTSQSLSLLSASETPDSEQLSNTHVLPATQSREVYDPSFSSRYLFLFSDGLDEGDLIGAIELNKSLFFPDSHQIKRGDGAQKSQEISQQLIDTVLSQKPQEDDVVLLAIHLGNPCRPAMACSEFPSTFEAVDDACSWLEETLTPQCIPKGKDRDLILLAAREAFLNAVEHGNAYTPTAFFEARIYADHTSSDKNQLIIEVMDEGSGFQFKETMDNIHHLQSTRIGKRGLAFMDTIADGVHVDGPKVILKFIAS